MPSFWTFKNSFRWLSKLARGVTLVDPGDWREDDTIIAIMGPPGSGKSTFVSVAMGDDRGIGDSLTSKTAEVTPFICISPNFVNIGRDASTTRRIVFVDTPGFDGSDRPDSAILKEIARWLERSYRNSIYISGIIYMHRISDNRMAGTPFKDLKMFQQLCGPDFASKMLLVTTMWDEEETEIAQKREAELRSSFWGELITRGADTTRFVDGNAWDVVAYLIRRSVTHQVRGLLVQKELGFEEDKKIPETSAGRTLEGEITEITCIPSATTSSLMTSSKYAFEAFSCQAENVKKDDVVVILLGLSGSGKSNFIEKAVGNTHLGLAGNSIHPFTKDVQGFRYPSHGSFGDRLVLVDTPGLDSEEGMNSLMEKLDSWLKTPNKPPTIVLFFHRISDGRKTYDPYQYLSIISKKYPQTRLGTVTTMWDKKKIDQDIKEGREWELRRSGWRKMVNNVMDQRFMNTTQSAHDILLLASSR